MVGYAVGALSYFVGIILSFLLDLPTGAVVVWSMAIVAILLGLMISDKRELI
jgi:zinc/manganese transport system permease protein